MPAFALRTVVVVWCLAVAGAGEASAQQTRAEELAARRAEKAKNLEPYKPKGPERVLLYIEEKRIIERLTEGDGLYPRIGGLTTGSGFAAGVGYRKHFADDEVFLDVSGAFSAKKYIALDAKLMYPRFWRDRIELWSNVRYRDFPQEDFYGLGVNSSRTARTSYAIESTDFNGLAALRVLPWLRIGTDVGLFKPDIGRGTDVRFPSTHDLFTDTEAPGLAAQPEFLYNTLFIEIDYRDFPGNARSGGLWRASYGTWNDHELDQFDFRRFDAEAAHFFPIFDKKRVFAFHMGLSYVNNERGHRVPFYFLPYIGGSDTVRGFREFRFRDENILYMNAEYRWEAFSGLDMALFVDAGEVRADWQDIDLHDLKTSYGIGFRFNTYKNVFLRFDVAMGGGEGTRMFLKFGKAF
jgi:outer membrane protein assembly factor BamA